MTSDLVQSPRITAILLAASMILTGCATEMPNVTPLARAAETEECVPYARLHSGIQIHGDAYTWWAKAEGLYTRGTMPIAGAVMVLAGYAGPNRGHLAVVRAVLNRREIRIDHQNWLNDGAIFVNDPVQDMSADNDWSRIRVWNIRTGAWGTKLYDVQGFIGPATRNNAAS